MDENEVKYKWRQSFVRLIDTSDAAMELATELPWRGAYTKRDEWIESIACGSSGWDQRTHTHTHAPRTRGKRY